MTDDAEDARPVGLLLDQRDPALALRVLRLAGSLAARGVVADLIVALEPDHAPVELPDGLDLVRLDAGSRRTRLHGLSRYLRLRRPRWLLVDGDGQAGLAFGARWLAGAATHIALRDHTVEEPPDGTERTFLSPLARRGDVVLSVSTDRAQTLARRWHLPGDAALVLGDPAWHDLEAAWEAAVERQEIAEAATAPTATAAPSRHVKRSPHGPPTRVLIATPGHTHDAATLSEALRLLADRRTLEPIPLASASPSGLDATLRDHLQGRHVVLTVAGRPHLPVLLPLLLAGANVVAVGRADLRDQVLARAGLVRCAASQDPARIADVLEDAIDHPLRPDPDATDRWVTAMAADAFVTLLERDAHVHPVP